MATLVASTAVLSSHQRFVIWRIRRLLSWPPHTPLGQKKKGPLRTGIRKSAQSLRFLPFLGEQQEESFQLSALHPSDLSSVAETLQMKQTNRARCRCSDSPTAPRRFCKTGANVAQTAHSAPYWQVNQTLIHKHSAGKTPCSVPHSSQQSGQVKVECWL